MRGNQGSVNDGSDDEQRIAGAPIATKVEERGVETAKGVGTHAPMTDENFQVAVNRRTRITSKRDRPDIQEPNASKRALLHSQEPQWQDFLQEQLGSVDGQELATTQVATFPSAKSSDASSVVGETPSLRAPSTVLLVPRPTGLLPQKPASKKGRASSTPGHPLPRPKTTQSDWVFNIFFFHILFPFYFRAEIKPPSIQTFRVRTYHVLFDSNRLCLNILPTLIHISRVRKTNPFGSNIRW